MSNISVSVWWYKELEKKYDKYGNFMRYGPAYRTAITDKLFFDIDCIRQDGTFDEEAYNSMQTIYAWAQKNDYTREVAFTSGGYQMTVAASLRPECYENTVKYVAKSLDVKIDENISLATMRRVVGSFNFGKERKSPRNTFCIPLKESEVYFPFYKHVEIAKKQRKGLIHYGKNVYIPPVVKEVQIQRELDRRTDFTYADGLEVILEKYGYQYSDICPRIQAIIEQPRVSHDHRVKVITYLKDIIGINYGDMLLLLPKLLTAQHGNGNDGTHSIEELQVDSVYKNNLHFSPSKMKADGYCDSECNICQEYIDGLRYL